MSNYKFIDPCYYKYILTCNDKYIMLYGCKCSWRTTGICLLRSDSTLQGEEAKAAMLSLAYSFAFVSRGRTLSLAPLVLRRFSSAE
jgi:hypothetical protein